MILAIPLSGLLLLTVQASPQAKANILDTSNRHMGKRFYNTSSLVILPLSVSLRVFKKHSTAHFSKKHFLLRGA